MIRYGEKCPGDAATYYRDGKKIHSFSETRWNLAMHREVMLREGFDHQVAIPDNRKLDVPILVHPGTRVFENQDCHPWLVGSERYDGFKMLATRIVPENLS